MKINRKVKIALGSIFGIFLILFVVLVVHIATAKPLVIDNASLQISRIDFETPLDSVETKEVHHNLKSINGVKNIKIFSEKGIVVFEIGIHGIPVNLDSIVYENLRFGALLGYPTFNLDNRDEYYYKRVYLGCLRSVDFIFSLPEFDGSNLIVMGGSQGGALALATAALDKRVKTILCTHPALSDLMGYQHGRAGGWPHMFAKKEHLTKEKIETSRYYDAVNFARLISIPGFYSLGYNDETTPPTSLYATFNSIKAPKTFFIDKETGHAVTQAQRNKQIEFILQTLKMK